MREGLVDRGRVRGDGCARSWRRRRRSRSQIASITASIGVRSGNSVLIWKVRVRPRRTRSAARQRA